MAPRPRWRAHALVVGVLLLVIACQTVPLTGRRQLVLLPEGEELKMGLASYQEVLSKSRKSTDAAATARVVRVGRRIAAATDRTDYQWEFALLEDNQANAFCLPGGKVAVYTGLLPVAQDDAGLAVVLAHEAAHAIARHGGERVSQQLLVQGGLAATQVALANRDPIIVQAATALLGAGATVGMLLPWGRQQESEADHLGLIYMAKAGYHPSAAITLWQRMGAGGQRQVEFLSTHPSPETRIEQIRAWIPEALTHYKPQ
jgi:predicted Zn-dependent protease